MTGIASQIARWTSDIGNTMITLANMVNGTPIEIALRIVGF